MALALKSSPMKVEFGNFAPMANVKLPDPHARSSIFIPFSEKNKKNNTERMIVPYILKT